MFVACTGRGTFEMGRPRPASPLRPALAAGQPFLAPLRLPMLQKGPVGRREASLPARTRFPPGRG